MTTIAISRETKETLRLMGEKDESYECILRRLIKEAGLKKLDDRWNRILEKNDFIPLDEL